MVSGVALVIRNNWPYYVWALCVAAASAAVGGWLDVPGLLQVGLTAVAVWSVYWSCASLTAVYWAYDRSQLYRLDWLRALLPASPCRAVNIHAGLDLTSQPLRRLRPCDELYTVDIFDPAVTTEASIRRAHRVAKAGAGPLPSHRLLSEEGTVPNKSSASPPADTVGKSPLPGEGDSPRQGGDSPLFHIRVVGDGSCIAAAASAERMPFGDSSCDVVYLILSAHEVRDLRIRERLFQEIERILRPQGRLVLLEHLRDAWNFAAFGPGFFHFLPKRQWDRAARQAGFFESMQTRRTPFLHLWLFRKSGLIQ